MRPKGLEVGNGNLSRPDDPLQYRAEVLGSAGRIFASGITSTLLWAALGEVDGRRWRDVLGERLWRVPRRD